MSPISVFDWQTYRDLFTTPEMAKIFDEQATFAAMVEAEKAATRAQGKIGIVPAETAKVIDATLDAAKLDLERLQADTLDVGRPIAGLAAQLAEQVDPPHNVWVHYGITTYDVMDTGRELQIRDAMAEILAAIGRYQALLVELAEAHRDTVMVGRTNNHHALPTTFGGRVAVWIEELLRHRERLEAARDRLMVVGFSGAVGTLAGMRGQGLEFRTAVAEELGLGETITSWHNARDMMTELSLALGNLAASLARNAQNINALGSTEVQEISERGGEGRGRSTALPHKRNPRAAEFAEATARLARQRAMGMVEIMGQESDRCGGTWIGEWLLVPETFLLSAGALHWASDLVGRLDVDVDRMRANFDHSNGMAVGERFVLEMAQRMSKFEARKRLDAACIKVYEQGISLADALAQDPAVLEVLSEAEIKEFADPANYVGAAPDMVDAVVEKAKQK
ncbi:MAG TPA: 3-carboxy-cis,cis-muconate cycloisomerase [Rhodospirillaceae bacterium]|nr:3-carboxy-cis,cis-muconate cycloisomerase [Rhodospirillaceae bacterium]